LWQPAHLPVLRLPTVGSTVATADTLAQGWKPAWMAMVDTWVAEWEAQVATVTVTASRAQANDRVAQSLLAPL
jgi:hypothetical protein